MESSTFGSKAFDAFEMRLVDMGGIDIAHLHPLSISVGWPHRSEDWDMLRQVGHGTAVLDEIDRVLGSAMWFPHGTGFATLGMVITTPRLQTLGTGQWLMRHILAQCGERALRLNATRAARRLYLSLNFKPEKTVFQCQGESRAPEQPPKLPSGAELRLIEPSDLPAIVDLDSRGFGVERHGLMAVLTGQSTGFGLFRNSQMDAFSLCRKFGRGRVIGPVVAASDEDAIAVVAPHVAEANGTFLRIDTHLEKGPFTEFLARCGLPVFDTVLTMTLNASFIDPNQREAGQKVTYALASQALG